MSSGDARVLDPPGPDGDRALVDLAAEAQVARNKAHAAQLEAVSDFHARRVAEVAGRDDGPGSGPDKSGFFLLTPLQATKVEFAPLLGLSELHVQLDLDLTDDLRRWLPEVWRRCRSGRLDLGRAQVVQAQLGNLTSDEDRAAYAELVQAWMSRHDDPEAPVFPVPRHTLQRAARRLCLKLPQKSDDDSFADAFRRRRVSFRADENGMAGLSCTTAVHDAMRADYRLTLIAKRLQEQSDDERTLEQLRADVMVDLLLGRLVVRAGGAELEDPEAPAPAFERSRTVGRWARPVINVTVPLETLAGFTDEPGRLAGGSAIPADLARRIALEPGSTWHRMLTDEAGGLVALSTDGYSPTEPIWRWVVARDRECVFPGCFRPASVVDLDHREPYPVGATSTANLQPLCRRHHTVKHSEGFRVGRAADGSSVWTSRFGSVFRSPPPEHPVGVRPVTGEIDEVVEWDESDPIPDHVLDEFEQILREWHDAEVIGADR